MVAGGAHVPLSAQDMMKASGGVGEEVEVANQVSSTAHHPQ